MLKPIPIDKINYQSGSLSSDIQSEIAGNSERLKASLSNAHSATILSPRLKSRKCLLRTSVNLEGTAVEDRTVMWKKRKTHFLKWMEPQEGLAAVHREL